LMKVQETEDQITKIILSGRLDINGSLEIDKDFMDAIKAKKDVVVDMSEVTFIMSLGMRTLVSGAKEVAKNGGKLVISSPQANVEDALRESSLDTILPIISSNTDLKKFFGK
jgi:anti-sigma B factor antagonist